jgi:tetratricopeptide (TPR) repeat protein
MISKWLFSGAVALEIGSWVSVLTPQPVASQLSIYLSSHALGCLLVCAAVWRALPDQYRSPVPWSPLFIFSLAFFIPGIGMLGVMAAVFPALYLPRKRSEQLWQSMEIPSLPFQAQQPARLPFFADGGLQDVLRHAADPERRLSALLASRRIPGRQAVPILKLALADPSDDVRLLAYSMLDKLENDINVRIQAALIQLAEADPGTREQPSTATGALHGTLARWYWELAYLGLAQGSVLEHVLDKASEHAREALQAGEGGELLLLAGRIALERRDIERAQQLFEQAQAQGMEAAKVLPFRAELAFEAGRYHEIPGLLASLPEEARQRPPLAAMVRNWT